MNPSATTPNKARSKRVTLYFIGNLCIALLMLFALPLIYKNQQAYAPHTQIDKEYVNTAISSGEAEFLHAALKTTETARAMAYDSQVTTMTLMLASAVALAALFLLNSLLLFRLRSEPTSAPVSA